MSKRRLQFQTSPFAHTFILDSFNHRAHSRRNSDPKKINYASCANFKEVFPILSSADQFLPVEQLPKKHRSKD